MFTGIIESVGVIDRITESQANRCFYVSSPISDMLKIDQSLSHDGVCLTIDEVAPGSHRVTAVAETLLKTKLSASNVGDRVNLERCLPINGRLDGHVVQGHVDTTAICVSAVDASGSYVYTFEYPRDFAELIVEKGSICVNGISLTAYNVTASTFSVAIIPYTYENTNISSLKPESIVNIEFDIFGKYAQRIIKLAGTKNPESKP